MVLADGDRHGKGGKGYVTPIVVNANEILFLPIRVFLSPHYMIWQGLIGQLKNHEVNHLHNLQTIIMGII